MKESGLFRLSVVFTVCGISFTHEWHIGVCNQYFIIQKHKN